MSAEPRHAREILSYFLRNEGAADDLEGIARWRLLEETIYHSVADTECALKWLVDHGFLRQDATAAGGRIFSLERSKRDCVEDFLRQAQRDGE
jgi:hypothetical protein